MTVQEMPESPRWNTTTKAIVAIIAILFGLAVLWRFQTLISPLIIAVILAYLLNPIIGLINTHTHLNRATIVTLVHAVLAILVIGAFIAVGVAVYRQALNLIERAPEIIATFPERIEAARQYLTQPIRIGAFEFQLPLAGEDLNLEAISNWLLGYVDPIASRLASSLGSFALATLQTLGWLIFILFVSIYISNDIPRAGELIGGAATAPGYRKDAERLWREFGRVWHAYVRGQAILGLVIGLVVSLTLGLLGVENALALGLLSGLLEFIPMVGPIIGAVAAVIVALFQTAVPWGLTNLQFALIVLAAMVIIQQIENSILVPRIVGDALDLHPILVLVGAIMGSTLGGILGAILAAPVIASLKLIGRYAWRKMFDLPPFDQPEPDEEDDTSWIENWWEQWQLRRAKAKMNEQ